MSARRIDDHSNWTGKAPRGQVYANGAKTQSYSSEEGVGHLGHYEDTTEAIAHMQDLNKKKVHGHPQKPYHRY